MMDRNTLSRGTTLRQTGLVEKLWCLLRPSTQPHGPRHDHLGLLQSHWQARRQRTSPVPGLSGRFQRAGAGQDGSMQRARSGTTGINAHTIHARKALRCQHRLALRHFRKRAFPGTGVILYRTPSRYADWRLPEARWLRPRPRPDYRRYCARQRQWPPSRPFASRRRLAKCPGGKPWRSMENRPKTHAARGKFTLPAPGPGMELANPPFCGYNAAAPCGVLTAG